MVSHLSLSRDVETGLGVPNKDHTVKLEDKDQTVRLEDKDQTVRLEDKDQPDRLVVGSQRKELDHEYNKEPYNKWEPREEQDIVHDTPELSTPTYSVPEEEACTMDTPRRVTSKENTLSNQPLRQNVLVIAKSNLPTEDVESVLNTITAKEEPPDFYQQTSKRPYPDCRVLRTKPFEEGEYDEDIRPSPTKDHEEDNHELVQSYHREDGPANLNTFKEVPRQHVYFPKLSRYKGDEDIGSNNSQDQEPKDHGFRMPWPRASRLKEGFYKAMKVCYIIKNPECPRKYTSEEADIQGSSHDPGLEFKRDFALVITKKAHGLAPVITQRERTQLVHAALGVLSEDT